MPVVTAPVMAALKPLAPAPPSSVHTGGATGQLAGGRRHAAELAAHYEALRDLTAPFRRTLARKHWRAATAAMVKTVTAPGPEAAAAVSTRRWHEQRAKGQIERFERVDACGSTHLVRIECGGCAAVSERELRCGHHRLCQRCLSRRIRTLRARLFRAVRHWSRRMPRGWGRPKFLTLTLPHSGDVRADAAALTLAFNRFWKLVRLHLRDRGIPAGQVNVPWTRVLEITDSNGGHAHLHCLWFGPFVHHEVFAWLWARALPQSYRDHVPVVPVADLVAAHSEEWKRKQLRAVFRTRRGRFGRALTEVPQPFVDVRAIYSRARSQPNGHADPIASPGDAVVECAKYLIKQGSVDPKTGKLVLDAVVGAALYEALEGRRVVQSSLGFWDHAKVWTPPPCPHCGSTIRKAEVVRASDPMTCSRLVRGP